MTPPAARPTVAERACAVLARLLLAGALAAIAAGAVANWKSTLAYVGGLVMAVMAGWYVVSRRGAARVAALAMAAGGAALVGLGLTFADISLLRIILTVTFAAASGGSPGGHCTVARVQASLPPAAGRPRCGHGIRS